MRDMSFDLLLLFLACLRIREFCSSLDVFVRRNVSSVLLLTSSSSQFVRSIISLLDLSTKLTSNALETEALKITDFGALRSVNVTLFSFVVMFVSDVIVVGSRVVRLPRVPLLRGWCWWPLFLVFPGPALWDIVTDVVNACSLTQPCCQNWRCCAPVSGCSPLVRLRMKHSPVGGSTPTRAWLARNQHGARGLAYFRALFLFISQAVPAVNLLQNILH